MSSKIQKFEKKFKETKTIKTIGRRKTALYRLLNEISSSYKYRTKRVSNLTRRIKLSIYQLDLKEENPRLYKKRIKSLLKLAVNAKKHKKTLSNVLNEEFKKLGPADRRLFRLATDSGKLAYLLLKYGEAYAKSNITIPKKKIIEAYNKNIELIYPESSQWIHYKNLDDKVRQLIVHPVYSVKVTSYELSRDKKHIVVRYEYVICTSIYSVPLQQGGFILKFSRRQIENELKTIR